VRRRGVTIDVDATLITSQFREAERGRELQGRLRFSPLQVYLDETRDALSAACSRVRRLEHRR
jgi:hypothetical protein